MGQKKQTYVQMRTPRQRIVSAGATTLSFEQVCEFIGLLWPAHSREDNPPITTIRVWDNQGLKNFDCLPEYVFTLNKMK